MRLSADVREINRGRQPHLISSFYGPLLRMRCSKLGALSVCNVLAKIEQVVAEN